AAILGASAAGARAMTATSGPGLSLMMENIGLAVMLEIPCVVVDVQRGSPSTGLPTMPGQSDVMQARWGSHGDYEIVAYSPWSVQEMFDLTILAFNIADRYRTPVLMLCDEVVGHMIERLVIPTREQIEIWSRKKPKESSNGRYDPFKVSDPDLVPPMMHAGEGYKVHFTGLTHDVHGYPDMSAETHHNLVTRLVNKIQHNADQIIRTEGYWLEDAEIVVVAYGCTARSAQRAVREARENGIPVGLLRLISIWPFPENLMRGLAERTKTIIIAEMNLGQISREIQRVIGRPVQGVFHAGGEMIPPDPILEAIQEAAK
ncbi:MAG TPA: 2-oxoacid:acceptor oxidoreductase subunit alpha, partial [Anaerolineales bacterium]|nr:2-oxoacid:acceptor oxidoreductase subunit alpha [Anaerolineales bacterium]